MCIGIPMQVLEVTSGRALCADGEQSVWVDHPAGRGGAERELAAGLRRCRPRADQCRTGGSRLAMRCGRLWPASRVILPASTRCSPIW